MLTAKGKMFVKQDFCMPNLFSICLMNMPVIVGKSNFKLLANTWTSHMQIKYEK